MKSAQKRTSEAQIQFDLSAIPKSDIRLLCSTFLSAAKQFYEDPKNLEDFEKWKDARESK